MKNSYYPLVDGIKPADTDCSGDGCSRTGYQYAEISLPIEIEPGTKLGEIKTECCGEPTVKCRTCEDGMRCEVIITQKICIKIPVCYSVKACAGKEKTECDNCCCD